MRVVQTARLVMVSVMVLVPAFVAGFLSAALAGDAPDAGRRAPWTTTADGTPIALVRVGATFDRPIPFGVRICVDDGPFGVTVHHWELSPKDKSKSERVDTFLKPTQCISLPRAYGIILQKTESVTGAPAKGFYHLYKPLTAAGEPVVGSAADTLPENAADAPVVSNPLVVNATCKPFRKPLPDKSYWERSCEIPQLVKFGSARVCFEEGYTNQPKGQIPNAIDYTGALLPMILDRRLNRPDSALSGESWSTDIFNPLVAGGCRDLFRVRSAFIVVGPQPPNFPWKPEFVQKITMKLHRIVP